jgi:hypothetical protein
MTLRSQSEPFVEYFCAGNAIKLIVTMDLNIANEEI